MTKKPEREWPGRLVLLGFGALFATIGYGSVRQGHLWVESHDSRSGFDFTPTLYLELVGLIFLFVGAIPWKPIQRFLSRFPSNSKEARTRHGHHHDGRM